MQQSAALNKEGFGTEPHLQEDPYQARWHYDSIKSMINVLKEDDWKMV